MIRSQIPLINDLKRVQRKRVFGKDITNTYNSESLKPLLNKDKIQKNQKIIEKPLPIEQKQNHKTKQEVKTDPINQYRKQILEHMLSLQKKYVQNKDQKITINMRQILIDWMIDVHNSFELKEQTLHLALGYLNEYQSKSIILKQEYQLVGITCLWIASKFQQIYPPRMKNYVDVTADTYSLGQLRKMQEKILQKLNFNMNHITKLQILQTSIDKSYQKSDFQKKSIAFAKYILQLITLDGQLVYKHCPSKLVSTVILVSNAVFKTKLQNKKIQQIKCFNKEEIYQCYKEIVQLLRRENKFGSDSIKRKYQSQKYFKVSKLKIQLKNQQKSNNV